MSFATNPNDRTRIAYEEVGVGPPLVLFHGSGTSRDLWKAMGYIDRLAGDYRLILIDSRGHGDSDKPLAEPAYAMEFLVEDVLAVLDQCGVDDTNFFGYSLGGRVGFALGISAPERLRSLIIGGGSHRSQRGAFDRVLYPGFLSTIQDKGIDAFLEEWGHRLGQPIQPAVRAVFLANDPQVLVTFLRQSDNEPGFSETALANLHVPTLLFAGDDDVERLEDSRAACALMPDARLVVVPSANHLSTLAKVDEVLAVVRPFLASA